MQMIDARAAKLSDYSYPITKSSNWTAIIGYPRDNYAANRRAQNQSRASILLLIRLINKETSNYTSKSYARLYSSNKPIEIQTTVQPGASAGKDVRPNHDWFWLCKSDWW